MTLTKGVVTAGRGDIKEECTTSGDGIRQDFVISNKPENTGKLLLDLAVGGAGVTTKKLQDGIEVRLYSGRALVYHALKATDAAGHALASSFLKANDNVITISVDDNNATYPVRIDPTISDADWVSIGGQVTGLSGLVWRLRMIIREFFTRAAPSPWRAA